MFQMKKLEVHGRTVVSGVTTSAIQAAQQGGKEPGSAPQVYRDHLNLLLLATGKTSLKNKFFILSK